MIFCVFDKIEKPKFSFLINFEFKKGKIALEVYCKQARVQKINIF